MHQIDDELMVELMVTKEHRRLGRLLLPAQELHTEDLTVCYHLHKDFMDYLTTWQRHNFWKF